MVKLLARLSLRFCDRNLKIDELSRDVAPADSSKLNRNR
jgi:hypothetical protein